MLLNIASKAYQKTIVPLSCWINTAILSS